MLYEGREFDPEALVALLDSELKKAKPSHALLEKLGMNPKTRLGVQRLVKEIEPDRVIPELDAAQPVLDELKALRDQIAEKDKKEAEKEAARAKADEERETTLRLESGRSLLRSRGYQKEGIEKIEKLMVDRNLPDFDAAMALFERDQPKENSAIPSSLNRSWDFLMPGEDDKDTISAVTLPKGRGQENALQRATFKEVANTLRDLRSGRAA